MKRLGVKTVPLKGVEGWQALYAAAKSDQSHELHRMAVNIAETMGPLNIPGVCAEDLRVLHGHHRLACCALLGHQEVQVDLISLDSTADRRIIALSEEIYRKHLSWEERGPITTELLDLLEERAQKRAAQLSPQVRAKLRGRPKTPRGEARKELAEAQGVAERAIESREERERARAQDPPRSREPGEDDLPGLPGSTTRVRLLESLRKMDKIMERLLGPMSEASILAATARVAEREVQAFAKQHAFLFDLVSRAIRAVESAGE